MEIIDFSYTEMKSNFFCTHLKTILLFFKKNGERSQGQGPGARSRGLDVGGWKPGAGGREPRAEGQGPRAEGWG